ncbi:division/cell wall cluster transcriptional repressor MraZ [Acidobacteria bacterium ACD]|nr:MAG: division/cell wall cluster transcriptional repressor MraZ [Acidobacteriota bacterium]MDL1951180.1 division/cell wall cluster transcriptional repressor MraZ [Acidobacteria bacterium ACD]
MMDRLRGSAETTVDDKGRFKVPAVFRDPVEGTYGTEFFLTSISGSDVLIYPMPVWNAIEEKLAQLPAVHRARTKFLERVNTFGQVARMDAQGRLIVPSLLRDVAAIQGEALVLGQTDHLVLVDRERHLAALKGSTFTAEDYDELARHLV